MPGYWQVSTVTGTSGMDESKAALSGWRCSHTLKLSSTRLINLSVSGVKVQSFRTSAWFTSPASTSFIINLAEKRACNTNRYSFSFFCLVSWRVCQCVREIDREKKGEIVVCSCRLVTMFDLLSYGIKCMCVVVCWWMVRGSVTHDPPHLIPAKQWTPALVGIHPITPLCQINCLFLVVFFLPDHSVNSS